MSSEPTAGSSAASASLGSSARHPGRRRRGGEAAGDARDRHGIGREGIDGSRRQQRASGAAWAGPRVLARPRQGKSRHVGACKARPDGALRWPPGFWSFAVARLSGLRRDSTIVPHPLRTAEFSPRRNARGRLQALGGRTEAREIGARRTLQGRRPPRLRLFFRPPHRSLSPRCRTETPRKLPLPAMTA